MSSVIRRGMGLRFAMASAGAVWLSGCVGQAVVGEEAPEDEETAGDGDGDEPVDCSGATPPQPPVPLSNYFSNLAGTVWEGYFEGGSDVTLVLGADGTGTYYVGEKRDFDPPTDPYAGYLCYDRDSVCSVGPAVNGFQYSVQGAQVDGRRLQFTADFSEPWSEWCALQTPIRRSPSDCVFSLEPSESGIYSFTGDRCYLGAEDDAEKEEVDCGRLNLIFERVCRCNSEGCVADEKATPFDLTANEEFTELSNSDGLRLFLVE